MEISLFQAVLCGLWYYFIDLGMPNPQSAFYTVYRPLVTGTVVGLILGHPIEGMMIGAYINLVFIGFLSVGGAQAQDPALAGILGTALGIASGMEPAMAVTLAVPLSLVGNFKTIFHMTFNSFFVRFSLKKIQEGDRRGVFIWNILLPQALQMITSTAIIVVAIHFGADAVGAAVNNMPGWVGNMLTTIGGLLPALGIAINLSVIARNNTMPYFFLGFIIIQYFKLDIIVVSALAIIMAAIAIGKEIAQSGNQFDFSAIQSDGQSKDEKRKFRLTKKQIRSAWYRYIFQAHSCYQYAMLQGISFCESMGYVMNVFYGNNKEKFIEEWKKHAVFYNTEPNVGSLIWGITVAMEEERANGEDVTPEAINNIKTSLMGPLAGIGDTFIQGAFVPILLSIFISLAMQGNLFAPFAYVIVCGGIIWFMALYLNDMGYKLGRQAVELILGSGVLNIVTSALGIVGCTVLGALAAQFVSVKTPLEFVMMAAKNASESSVVFNVQTQLFDVMFKGLLPLCFTVLSLALIRKGLSSNKVLLILLAIGAAGGALGILSI